MGYALLGCSRLLATMVTRYGPAFLGIAPGQTRAQSAAMYFLVVGACGQILGPPPVGLLTDLLGDPSMLRYAMTLQAAVVGVFALAIVALGMASFRRNVEEIERLIEATDSDTPGSDGGRRVS